MSRFVNVLAAALGFAAVAQSAPTPAVDLDLVDRGTATKDLVVDLGYARYNGTANTTTHVNSWLGMRYAASTEGKNRWQKPQPPATNRSSIVQANLLASNCPQGSNSPGSADFNFAGSEDCLFLNVQAPDGAKDLPVFFTIHGGGYGQGSASQDVTELINASNNSFVAVVIQYRLAAFGFLSSDDVQKHGTPNAGLYDQHFALQWTQKYIHLFGGDANRVTIMGESAGGGSVMQQSMAFGGSLGNSLFENAIAASPYLPTQPSYNDFGTTRSYLVFAQTAGCYSGAIPNSESQVPAMQGSIFQCLVSKDSYTLQNASSYASSSVLFGQWAFIPVTDGDLVRSLPSQQLESGQVNGQRLLCGNNADEGPAFVPQNITTEADFEDYAHTILPRFSESQFQQLLAHYPSTSAPVNPAQPDYATNGQTGATALNESTFGSGQQQRADNLYAETTFVCPSYWLNDAFSSHAGKTSYHYQFSVIGAEHGSDVSGYFGPIQPQFSPQFEALFMAIYANFVTQNNPEVPDSGFQPLENWPTWEPGVAAKLVDLNETGGTPYTTSGAFGEPVTQYEEPGLQVFIKEASAYSWEGGRGERCDFFKQVGTSVPE